MEQALAAFARGEVPKDGVADFAHLQEIIGFPEYYEGTPIRLCLSESTKSSGVGTMSD